jgi:hypothetical protein
MASMWSWLIACVDSFGWVKDIGDAELLLGYVHNLAITLLLLAWLYGSKFKLCMQDPSASFGTRRMTRDHKI